MFKSIAISWFICICVFITGCSSEYTVLDSIEGISLTSDSSSKITGETIVFNAVTNDGVNITENVQFFVNGNEITGNTFTSETIGSYEVKAKYFSVYSNPITIYFHDGSEINFLKRVLIEDYTGTWCGYCPRVSYAIEKVFEQTDAAVAVAIHRSSSIPSDPNYDPYNFNSSELESLPGIPSGYPKGLLNRINRWNPLEQNNIPQVIGLTQGDNPKLGLAMESNVENNQLELNVKVRFSKDFENLKLVVYVLENGLIYDQVNYTSFYEGANPIPNFVHNHVLRSCLTPLLGETIENNQTVTGNTYLRTFNLPIPSNISNAGKMEFVAFVVNENNHTINVRKANPNESQDFEEF